jgi:hypothetical protein
MHQLTIDTTTVTVTDHDGPDDARAALLNYAVAGDYYLRSVQTTAAHASYELLRLDDEVEPGHRRHEPRIAGTATIEELAGSPPPAGAPYFAACEAQRWISDAEHIRQHRSPANPYSAAVLTIARGAARGHLRCGSVASEAAALAGNTDNSRPDPATLEALRHNAIASNDLPATPVAIAAAVQQHLPAGTNERQTATLVWYYALILWGAAS